MTADDFFALAKKHQVDMVDLKFVDLLGTWQHCSFPIDLWDADTFKDGLGFAHIVTGYGPTESCAIVSTCRYDDPLDTVATQVMQMVSGPIALLLIIAGFAGAGIIYFLGRNFEVAFV